MYGALVEGAAANPFNGVNFTTTSVGLTSLSYEMSAVPSTHAYGPASYAGEDTEGVLHIENNVFEMVTNLHTPGGYFLAASAVTMSGGEIIPPNYVFGQVALRGNVAQHVDNALDVADQTTGFGCWNGGAVLIENNVFALKRSWPIIFDRSAMVSCVNNLSPPGAVIQGFDNAQGRAGEAYFPAAEEAMVLSML